MKFPTTNQNFSVRSRDAYRVVWGPQRFYLSIGWKTLIAFALVVSIPMSGLIVITESTLRSTLEPEVLRSLEANLRGAWRVYHSRVDKVGTALLQSAATPAVREAMRDGDSKALSHLLERHAALLPYTDIWLALDDEQRTIGRRHGPLGERVFLNNLVTRAYTFMESVTSTEVIPNRIFLDENPLTYSNLDVQVLTQVVVVPVQEQGRLLGSLVGLILLNDDDWLPNAIHDYLSIDAAVFGSVIQDARIIAASGRPNNIWAPGLLAPTELRDHIRTGSVFRGSTLVNDIPVFVVSEPIKNSEGLPIGALSIGVRSSKIDALLWGNTRNIYLFMGVGVLLSVLIAFLAYRDTMTPMRAIVRAMEDFARGRLDVRTEILTKDEFEELGSGFNRLADAIQEHQERIESFNSLSSLLITSLKPRDLMQNVLDKVIELTHSQSGVIYLTQTREEQEILVPYVAYAVDVERMEPLRMGDGLPGEAALKRRAIAITEVPEECRLNVNFGFADTLPKEIAIFPIVYRDSSLGVMVLGTLNGFRTNELSLLEYMTNQVAVVLENALTHEKVERLSITDTLTGVFNRGYIEQVMEASFADSRRYKTPMSLPIIDLDHFKRINDRFGHQVGDRALIAVTDCMRQSLRENDRLGRYGGEEFIVVLPHTSVADAVTTAEKLRTAISKLTVPGMGDERVTVSIGVAGLPDNGTESVDDLVRRADRALYEAKNSGRDRVVVAAA